MSEEISVPIVPGAARVPIVPDVSDPGTDETAAGVEPSALEQLTIVSFLWRHGHGRQQYRVEHANTWARMIHRHLSTPHRFVVVTDQPDASFDPLIQPMPLWSDWRELHNPTWTERSACYPRLKLFSRDAAQLLAPATRGCGGLSDLNGLNGLSESSAQPMRIVCMDLDCVALGPLDALFDREEDFVILRRTALHSHEETSTYHGALWMLRAGARPQVWEGFRGLSSVAAAQKYVGSDQAWLRHCLGPDEAGWTQADGVYCTRNLEVSGRYAERPPDNARLIFFNNNAKPWDYGRAGSCRECGLAIGHAVRVRCPRCKTVNIQPPQSWVADYWQ